LTFDENPYRRNAFDAFPLSKLETSIRNIRRVINKARGDWKDNRGVLIARDGAEWQVTEAQLNSLEDQLLDPLRRLQVEQFVHQEHLFAEDDEIRALAQEIEAALRREKMPVELLDRLRAELIARLTRLLPAPHPAAVTDDLPWPEPPPALSVSLEPFESTLLRER
jgi:hypothetical protein